MSSGSSIRVTFGRRRVDGTGVGGQPHRLFFFVDTLDSRARVGFADVQSVDVNVGRGAQVCGLGYEEHDQEPDHDRGDGDKVVQMSEGFGAWVEVEQTSSDDCKEENHDQA